MDTRIQFGGVAGCGVFGRPADPTTITDIVRLSDKMGVSSNPEKVHDFAEEQRYIGFIWNAKERTVRLPADKLEERKMQVADFLAPKGSFYLKDADKFVGRLVHTCYIVPHLQWFDTRRIIPDTTPVDLNWVGDASLKGIGVLIGGKKWAQFKLLNGWNVGSVDGVNRNIAWAETITPHPNQPSRKEDPAI